MNLKIYCDGASNGNPGRIGIGIIIKLQDGSIAEKISSDVGYGTNNEAELIAINVALEKAMALNAKNIEMLTDSQLSVNLINGRNKTKKSHLKRLLDAIASKKSAFHTCKIEWISRDDNGDADQLANDACGIKQDICDKCGGKMLRRHRNIDGHPFYGCSNYPKCRNTIDDN